MSAINGKIPIVISSMPVYFSHMADIEKINELMGRNLKRLRESCSLTQARLAELADTTPSYISQLETGRLGMGKRVLSNLSKALNVDASEFTKERNDRLSIPPPSGEIAVISLCEGGPAGFYEVPYSGGGFRYIKRPYDVTDPGAYAVEVRGSSMSPRYEEGEMVIASPEKEVRSGDYVVVQMVSGEMAIKRIKFHSGMIILSSVNPAVEAWVCKPEEIVAYHRVVWKKEKS